MDLITYTFSQEDFQSLLNNVKDQVIERVNADHGTNIPAEEYIFVLRHRNCLGRVLDSLYNKIFGELKDGQTHRILLRIASHHAKKDVQESKGAKGE